MHTGNFIRQGVHITESGAGTSSPHTGHRRGHR